VSKALSSWLGLSLCILGCFCATNNPASAQVTSDGTVNTQVTENGNTAEITGGETRGDNLFHSFQDFSVETGNEASFLNANDISNIFSRVTGGDISNIDGLISANGSANLFLINPAGIVFGEGARLDIGGSFYGSSASSILFEDGEFSATDLENPPLLTINAPIGLGFRDQPGDIVNNSVADDGNGLEVDTGKNLTLLGGNINFDGGRIFAPGGIVNLGGLTTAGTVSFTEDGSLSFPEGETRGDVSLANSSNVSVLASGGGYIFVNARNLDLTSSSRIQAGIGENLGSVDAQAGDVVINTTESVTLDGISADGNSRSGILNQVEVGAVGNGGALNITTPNLALTNGGAISTSTGGQGDGGTIEINATESITLDGAKSITLDEASFIGSLIVPGAVGNGGALNITTPNLTLTNGGQINSSTFGQGDSGRISINATESITLDGTSVIRNAVSSGASGNGEVLNVTTSNLALANGSQINSSTGGQGDGGALNIDATESIKIDGTSADGEFRSAIFNTVGIDALGNAGELNITTSNLTLTNGGGIFASTEGKGDGGSINIDATESIKIDGTSDNGIFASGLFNAVQQADAVGNGGALNITTPNLTLTNGGQINASTVGQGNAGNITINATDISFDGVGSDGIASRAVNNVEEGAVGKGGELKITTANLDLTNGGGISASTLGEGDGGSINIDATESVTLDGGGIANLVAPRAVGNGGALNITTPNLTLTNGGQINASTFGAGNAGNITIDATDISFDGAGSDGTVSRAVNNVEEGAVGKGGELKITTANLSLTNGGGISASTAGQGDGGTIDINATKSITLDKSSLIANFVAPSAVGNGGALNITTPNLTLTNGSGIFASTLGEGDGGSISINSTDVFLTNGSLIDASNFNFDSNDFGINTNTVTYSGSGNGGSVFVKANTLSLDNGAILASNFAAESPSANATPKVGGNITLDIAKSLSLDNESNIGAVATGNANGGNVNINANFIVAFPDGNNDITASALQRRGGNIGITSEGVFGIEERSLNDFTNDISASSEVSGFDGTVNINTSDINPVQGATELPSNVVEPEQTTAQACEAGRGTANNGLAIAGKGGVTPTPDAPLNSENIISSEQNPAAWAIPEPIETSQGKIQPARGITVTKSGHIVLTAYRTNNAGERIPESQVNCGQR
jgi:filamentous hemagglutinin family protein